jgi:hypothetical protein
MDRGRGEISWRTDLQHSANYYKNNNDYDNVTDTFKKKILDTAVSSISILHPFVIEHCEMPCDWVDCTIDVIHCFRVDTVRRVQWQPFVFRFFMDNTSTADKHVIQW